MIETSLNMFDAGVLIIVGLSALLSFFRGFVREIMSLGAWAGAALITLYSFQRVSTWIEPQVGSAALAGGLAAIGVFITALIAISFFIRLLLKFLKTGSDVGVLDNMIGLLFGIARGVLLISIAYFVMSIVVNEKDYPDWVKEAKSRPYVAQSAEYVARIAPDYLSVLTKKEDEKDADTKPSKAQKKLVKEVEAIEDEVPTIEDLQDRIREENERN